ncbi:nuclease-related domain-containing protein [Peribacillus frigoritolerans]|uniref:nuclease-related domain-containing protein n=1 Tax=Peribacillus frigoritolerans TaxID=450367 RepID=UPI001F4FCAE6|nr:nuclease-related domain-containing protein [Peribacillus frigoritolerans]MCK2017949.1 NERD domain-containing protein [Peribacillus frigoritolerans]
MGTDYKERQGKIGEEKTRKALEKLGVEFTGDCIIIHNLKFTFTYKFKTEYKAQIDHMVITPKKIFLIDSKHWIGEITFQLNETIQKIGVEDESHKDEKDITTQLRHHSYIINQLIMKYPQLKDLEIEALACFTHDKCKLTNQPFEYQALTLDELSAYVKEYLSENRFSGIESEDIESSLITTVELLQNHSEQDIELNYFDNNLYSKPNREKIKDSGARYVEMRFADGETYKGYVNSQNQFDGAGVLKTASGTYYRGLFVNGKKNGYGEFYGYKVERSFFEQEKIVTETREEDINKFIDKSYMLYKGTWNDDMREGTGSLELIDAHGNGAIIYDGEWSNDKRNGVGKGFSFNLYSGYLPDEYKSFEDEVYILTEKVLLYNGEWKDNCKEGNAQWKYLVEDPLTVMSGLWENDTVKEVQTTIVEEL